MFIFNSRPALGFIFISGISAIVADHLFGLWPGLLHFYSILAVISIALGAALLSYWKDNIKPISIFLMCFSVGAIFSYNLNMLELPYPDYIKSDEKALVQGVITDILKSEDGLSRYIVNGIIDTKSLEAIRHGVMVVDFSDNIPDLGSQVRIKGTIVYPETPNLPGEFDSSSYLKSKGCVGTVLTRDVSIDYTLNQSGLYLTWLKYLHKSRNAIDNTLRKYYSGHQYPVIKAMLLGDKSELSKDTRQMYSRSGTAHLLAVSGLHTGIVAAVVFFMLSGVRNKQVKFWVFTLLLTGFVILSGFQPSAIRAGTMAVIFLWIHLSERKADSLNVFAFAVAIALIIDPSLFYSIGFRMSVMAVLGILLFYSKLYKSLVSILRNRFVSSSLAVSVASSVLLFPYIAYVFGSFSIISPLANLVIVPIYSLGLVFSIIAELFTGLLTPIAETYHNASGFLLDIGMIANEYFASLSWASVDSEAAFPFAAVYSLVLIALLINVYWPLKIAIASTTLLFIITPVSEEDMRIYNRKNLVYIESQNSGASLILDKHYSDYPKTDFGLMNYLGNKLEVGDTVLISGLHGMKLTDMYKYDRKLEIIEIDTATQRSFLEKTNIDITNTSVKSDSR